MKLRYKIQEWLADRVSWVQYPNLRPADGFTRAASRSGYGFKEPMPPFKRLALLLGGSLLVLVGLAVLGALFFALYLIL